jgi:hypothetical protein
MSNVRHSQQQVLYFPQGGGWSVSSSVDENSPPPHIASKWPQLSTSDLISMHESLLSIEQLAPEPMRCASPELPTCCRGPPPPTPIPTTPINDEENNNDDLRQKLAHALKTIELQQKIIKQLCELKMHMTSDLTTNPL